MSNFTFGIMLVLMALFFFLDSCNISAWIFAAFIALMGFGVMTCKDDEE